MEIKNVEILRIGEIESFESGFKKVEWVVKTSEQYPQTLKLQSNKDKAEDLIKYNKVGDKVDVSINLLGREWTNKKGQIFVFNTLEAWKVFKVKNEDEQENKLDEPVSDIDTNEDLPF
jgi:translation initiation factor IF-3